MGNKHAAAAAGTALSRRALLAGAVTVPDIGTTVETREPGATHPDAAIFALCARLARLYDATENTTRPTSDPAVAAALEAQWQAFAGDLIHRRAQTLDGARAQVGAWLREFGDEGGAEELATIFGLQIPKGDGR